MSEDGDGAVDGGTGESIDPVAWVDSLPDALRDAPYFKPPEDGSHRTVEQVVADLTNAAQLQGNLSESHVRIPGKDAADADWDKFRERVQGIDTALITKSEDFSPIPEAADGYKDPEIDGFEPAETDVAAVKELAHKAKWNQQQYNDYMESLSANAKTAAEARSGWLAENQKALDTALGAAKDERLSRAATVLSDVLPEAMLSDIKSGAMDAQLVLAVDSLVQKIVDLGTEETQFIRQDGGRPGILTPSEAQSKADELFVELQKMNPGSRDYNSKMEKRMEYIALARRSA